jgi:SAM-dependent methyltransferase
LQYNNIKRLTGVLAALREAFGAKPKSQDPDASPKPDVTAPKRAPYQDLKSAYIGHVEDVRSSLPHEEAMAAAVGGGWDSVGAIEVALLRKYGLLEDGYVIDVGCGSGRLANPLSVYLRGRYLGTDLVPVLLDHARKLVARPGWRFEEVDHIRIPESDDQADMVVFFSVMTHLLHEQSYWYLEEARRVLKPDGRVIFSFLEFKEPYHWNAFFATLQAAKEKRETHLNVFMDRDWMSLWAEHLGMDLVDVRGAAEVVVPEGHLGQAICVLQKRQA